MKKNYIVGVLFAFFIALIPSQKYASFFAVDIGSPINTVEETKEVTLDVTSTGQTGQTVSSETKYKVSQESASGFLFRVKVMGLIGFGLFSHQSVLSLSDGGSVDPKLAVDTNMAELIGHVPIPLIPLTISGHVGFGTRAYKTDFLSSENSGSEVSAHVPVTKIGFEVGLEYSFIIAARIALGYNTLSGSETAIDTSDLYAGTPGISDIKSEMTVNPNATIFTLSVGIGF